MKRLRDAIGKRVCTLLFVGLAVSFNVSPVAADDLNESKERLNKIQKQIEEAMQGLRNKESQSGTLSEELARLSAETRRIERLTKKSNQQLLELSARLEKQRHSVKKIERGIPFIGNDAVTAFRWVQRMRESDETVVTATSENRIDNMSPAFTIQLYVRLRKLPVFDRHTTRQTPHETKTSLKS